MKFRLDSVPVRFDEAVQEVLNGLSEDERKLLLSLKGSEISSLHPSLGASIRGAWSLWNENTPLARDCRQRGLPSHPDDLALAILEEAWAELCGA